MEVYAYHEATSGYSATNLNNLATLVATAFVNSTRGVDLGGAKSSGVNNAFTNLGAGANMGDAQPAAYLNYILFDQSYSVMDAGWQVVPAASFSLQKVSIPQITVKEPGYIFVYLSYEDQSNNYVYFDDFKVTITPTNVIQSNEYYAHGSLTANSWTRDNSVLNNFLSNGGTELNPTTNLFDLDYRNFDPILGRMNGVDPMADEYASLTPYNFAFNDPVYWNDPSGADPDQSKIPQRYLPDIVDQGNAGGPIGTPNYYGVLFDQLFGPGGYSNVGGIADGFHEMHDFYSMTPWDFSAKYTVTLTGWQATSFFKAYASLYKRELIRRSRRDSDIGILGQKDAFVQRDGFGNYYVPYTNQVIELKNVKVPRPDDPMLNLLQFSLDLVGLIPGIGEVADGLNAGIYTLRGDYTNAALSSAAAVPFLGWAATGSKLVLKTLPYSSKSLAKTAKMLERGASSVTVANKSEAEELFMALYQGGNGKSIINTTGLTATEVKGLFGSKSGTYHWDLFDTQHGGIPHLQIHDFDGGVTRIFFK